MASTAGAIASIAEEPIRLAAGAAGDVLDARVVEPEAAELRAPGTTKIDARLLTATNDDRRVVGRARAEGHRDLLADLEAARPDRGADRRDQRGVLAGAV